MIRIAYLVSDYGAPSHTFVRREVSGLRASGIHVIPFSVQHKAPASADEAGETVESLLGHGAFRYLAALFWALEFDFFRLFSSWKLACTHRQAGLRGLLWSQFHFVEAVFLAQGLHRHRANRLHNHFANSGATVGMIAADFLCIPWSLTLHGISETDHPAGALLPDKLRRADFVACASFFMQAQAMRLVEPEFWPRMHIVRCGIDMDDIPDVSRAAAASDIPRLITVGRLSPEKGYFGLLEALAAMASDGIDWSLTIVGDGPAAQKLRARIDELALTDRIRLTGALVEKDTLAEIANADVMVLPSLMEGLPVVLIEALALQKPVLASRVAGIPELIEENRTGMMFTPSDWRDLEDKLRQLLASRSSWQAMGEAGHAKVVRYFQLETAAATMASLVGGEGAR